MTPLLIFLCVVCQLFLVVGQLLLKRAMNPPAEAPFVRMALRLMPGIGCLTAWFFIWLGLLAQVDLSHIFPFEGLNPALLVLGAWLFLKERMSATTWVGIALITGGIVLVV